MPAAQLLQALQVRRRDAVHAPGTDDGLGEDRRDAVRSRRAVISASSASSESHGTCVVSGSIGPMPAWLAAIPPMLVPRPWVPW